jgi:ParB family chromosome partitioning protein
MTETKRLGRGLEALLGPITREQAEAAGALKDLPISSVRPNPFQPRSGINETALAELSASIEVSGLLQPIVVRPRGSGYELIAGERRWRAIQRLGWPTIPAVVRDADDQTLLTLALIENLQRNDLSPIDEAQGYRRLMEEFEVPQAEVARLVARNRATVANLLRLLKLPPEVQGFVHDGKLSEGHARALLALEHPDAIIRLARRAASDGWSVREVESRVRVDARPSRRREARPLTPEGRRIEEALRRRLGTDVRIHPGRKGRGVLAINYYSNDDLARLLETILGEPFSG